MAYVVAILWRWRAALVVRRSPARTRVARKKAPRWASFPKIAHTWTTLRRHRTAVARVNELFRRIRTSLHSQGILSF